MVLQGESTLVVGSATLKARAGQVVVARAGWWNFPDVQPSELQAVIDRKAAVAINYPERYDGLWLLIYATGRNAAESLDMNEAAQEFYERRIFDRVFFLDARAEVAELKCQ
jgi:hypothetical protein